jgi:hypothetical protein
MTTEHEDAADIRKSVDDLIKPLLAYMNQKQAEGYLINFTINGDPIVLQKIEIMKKL